VLLARYLDTPLLNADSTALNVLESLTFTSLLPLSILYRPKKKKRTKMKHLKKRLINPLMKLTNHPIIEDLMEVLDEDLEEDLDVILEEDLADLVELAELQARLETTRTSEVDRIPKVLVDANLVGEGHHQTTADAIRRLRAPSPAVLTCGTPPLDGTVLHHVPNPLDILTMYFGWVVWFPVWCLCASMMLLGPTGRITLIRRLTSKHHPHRLPKNTFLQRF
jgi:hypothetical protein